MHLNMKKTFFLTMGFFFLLSGALALMRTKGYSSELALFANKQEVKEINCQIKELKEMKRGYAAKALYHESQAIRIQFIKDQLQIAKRHWNIAESNREIASKIQIEIKELKEKKKNFCRHK